MLRSKLTPFLITVIALQPFLVKAQSGTGFKATDRFFGIHFDFHATMKSPSIGKTLKAEDIAEVLDKVKPDYIQVDTKGHPGISSYPTAVGVAAPDIAQDPLKLFRAETAKRKVGLFSHFSGIMDEQAVKDHPDWPRIGADGKPSHDAASMFSPYAETYFVPQINELSTKYGIDGIWVDGDCWAAHPDHSAAAVAAYKKDTGKDAPRSSADPDWANYLEYTRQVFRKYLSNYVNAVHKANPKFLVASNWAFSSFMPGKIDAGVDYISGDLTSDAVADVEFESRAIAPQGKPWDLMPWGFMKGLNGQGSFWKSPRHLQQKAAMVLSQGGGYQVYIPQRGDGSLQMKPTLALAEVGQFARERKAYTYQTKPVPQVALFLSEYGHYNESGSPFENRHGGNDNVKGTLSLLLNSQYSVELLQEHHLEKDLQKYPVLVITEWRKLQPEFIAMVEKYVQQGGKVLTINGGHLFTKMLGNAQVSRSNLAGLPVREAGFGKGKIINVDESLSLRYATTKSDSLRQSVAGLVGKLFANPKVTVTGSDKVHLTLNTKNNNTLIHMVNVGDYFEPLADNTPEFKLPAIGKLDVKVRSDKKPKAVKLQPGNTSLPFEYKNGTVEFTVNGLDIYAIAEVSY